MPEGERARRSGGGLAALRAPVYRILDPLTDWMVRRRVHPNLLTTLGFALTVVAGVFYAVDHVRIAGAQSCSGAPSTSSTAASRA